MRYSVVTIGVLFLFASPARTSTYVVDQNGSGDFLTIQAAVNLLGDEPTTTTIDAGIE